MKNIFITGASGAIGSACCKAFLNMGCSVAAVYFSNREELEKIESKDGRLHSIKADIAIAAEVKKAFWEAVDIFGEIDVVINCAGIALDAVIQDTDDEKLSHIIDVNIKGTYNVCREACRHMVTKHNGSIVNIASMWGEVGASCESAYSMTKAAVIGLTKALAKEVGPSGIRVNCVSPGLIDTKMNDCYTKEDLEVLCDDTPLMRMGTPEDVASAVIYLSGEKASFVTGQVLGVNGGYIV